MITSLVGAVVTGFVGVAYVQRSGMELENPETIVLALSQALLHPFVAGMVLAAVLAAIMSTISSQLIVCSSALVEDLYRVMAKTPPSQKRLVFLGRMCVLAVALVAMALAINPNDTILELVGFAWAGFGAAFGPIVLLSLFWRRLSSRGALAGMITGAATVFIWDALEKSTGSTIFTLYEIVPGFLLNLIAAIVVSRLTHQVDPEIEEEFDRTGELVAAGRTR